MNRSQDVRLRLIGVLAGVYALANFVGVMVMSHRLVLEDCAGTSQNTTGSLVYVNIALLIFFLYVSTELFGAARSSVYLETASALRMAGILMVVQTIWQGAGLLWGPHTCVARNTSLQHYWALTGISQIVIASIVSYATLAAVSRASLTRSTRP